MARDLIIYPQETGGIAVVSPAPGGAFTIEQLADRDLPAGTPYKFISFGDLPDDRLFRNAWEADFSEPDGIALGYDAFIAASTQP